MLLYKHHCEYVLERVCVCVCVWTREERKGLNQGVNRNVSALIERCHADPVGARFTLTHTQTNTHTHTYSRSTQRQLVSVLCRLGYIGGLAERWADGREAERPTERPSAILQRLGLTVRPGHCTYQTAQQVRKVLLLCWTVNGWW